MKRIGMGVLALFASFGIMSGYVADPSLAQTADTKAAPEVKLGEPFMAIPDLCPWPNLVLLPDQTILATVFNNPSHANAAGSIDTWASKDGGLTWAYRSTPGPHEPNTLRNHQAVGLADNGDLITLTTGWTNEYPEGKSGGAFRAGLLHPWVSRSSDDGKTWEIDRDPASVQTPPVEGDPIVFGNIMPGADGDLRVAIYTSQFIKGRGTTGDRSLVYRSKDDGRTWIDPVVIDNELSLNETAILHLGEGVWLAAARKGTGGGGIQLYRSTDDAKTWEDLGRKTGGQHHPAHLLRLDDGRVLMVSGNRSANPKRVEARFSDDQGQTWTEPVTIATWSGDGGYPASIQREDGKIVTAYYGSAATYHRGYHMGVVVWEVDSE